MISQHNITRSCRNFTLQRHITTSYHNTDCDQRRKKYAIKLFFFRHINFTLVGYYNNHSGLNLCHSNPSGLHTGLSQGSAITIYPLHFPYPGNLAPYPGAVLVIRLSLSAYSLPAVSTRSFSTGGSTPSPAFINGFASGVTPCGVNSTSSCRLRSLFISCFSVRRPP